jgi:hypothetical protein
LCLGGSSFIHSIEKTTAFGDGCSEKESGSRCPSHRLPLGGVGGVQQTYLSNVIRTVETDSAAVSLAK